MPEREPDERAARVRVGVRRPLALQVRREQQPLGAGRPALGLGVELAVRRAPSDAAEPRERAGGREHHAHRVPRVRDGVAEDVHAPLGVGRVAGEHREDDARRPEHDRDRARPVDPDAERAGGLVARARDLGRLGGRRQPLAGDLERVADLVRPAAPRDVEEQRPRRVGDVDRALAGQPQPDVVLRQQDARMRA